MQVKKSAEYRKEYLASDLSLTAWRKYKEKMYKLLPHFAQVYKECEETLKLSGEKE